MVARLWAEWYALALLHNLGALRLEKDDERGN
jgi:hypothetical protein